MSLRSGTSPALAALALALLAPAARAQGETKPVLKEVQVASQKVTVAVQGGAVTIVGRNFHQCPAPPPPKPGEPPNTQPPPCPHAELEVEFGSKKCMILSSDFEHIVAIIPADASTGRSKLKVSIRGRGDGDIDLEVVTQEEFKKRGLDKKIGGETAGIAGSSAARDSAERAVLDSFAIGRFEYKRDATGSRFEAEGTASKLDEGLELGISLTINETRELEVQKVRVSKGTWRITFGPYTKQVLYGTYALNMVFELGKQPRVLAKRFRDKLSAEDQTLFDRVFRREFVTVGTDAEIAEQKTALQTHFVAMATETTKLMDEVEKAYASGCRVFYKPQGGASFDEAGHEKYCKEMGFAKTEAALAAIKNDWRFATKTGHFKPDDYKRWAEGTLIPGLLAQFQKHREFRDQFMKPVDERADMLGDYMISVVLEMFREYTRVLHDRAKVEVPEALRATPMDPVAAPTISRRFFDAQRRYLLRTVGRGDLIPPGEGDNDAEQPGAPKR
jgi:hypothetical protein